MLLHTQQQAILVICGTLGPAQPSTGEHLAGARPNHKFDTRTKLLNIETPAIHFAKPKGTLMIKRMDHVSIIVEDLGGAIAFFKTLGMELEGEMPVEGAWVDRLNGLQGVQVNISMMRTPDGHGRVELTKFRNPKLVDVEPAVAPPNTLGLRQIMFAVDNLDETLASLHAHGTELIGELVQYEDKYKLCYVRGPAGIIVALAEELF